MTMKNAMIASAVASMFVAGAAQAKGKSHKASAKGVKCAGVNGCSGQGACAGADNTCKAKNTCKGKGWIETKSEKECVDQHGTVVAMSDAKKM